MCGIAGIISLDGSNVTEGNARVKKMLANMSYRGPDGSGIYIDDNKKIVLGNNRLAITSIKQNHNIFFLASPRFLQVKFFCIIS